jgi:putative transposase
LFAFNDAKRVDENHRRAGWTLPANARNPLVHIHAFSLMPNHYHLLLSEVTENGISNFMQKLNMGYAKYFNERHDRSGYLWQGRHKKILVQNDAHFVYIPYYIHLNALDLSMPKWRDGKIPNAHRAIERLKAYRWSSFNDYFGEENFPSIISKEPLSEMLGSQANQFREIQNIISNDTLAKRSFTLE